MKKLKWVSELTSNHDKPSLNFINSLDFSKNSLLYNDLLNSFEENDIKFEVIKGYKFDSKNELESNFKIITLKVLDMENDYQRIINLINKEIFLYKKDKENIKIELIN